MILKEIPRKGEFHPWQLAEYLRRPKADALKAGLAQEWDSRVRDMFVFNFTQDEARAADPDMMLPELATNALVYTATHNSAVDDRHSYHHFVLSLAPGEHLTHEQWDRTLRSVLDGGEFGNCKAYGVMHVGEKSDCEHVHLVVCSIDKDTYRQHNAYKYVNKMIRAKDLMVDQLMADGAAITRENRINPQILTKDERLKQEARSKGRDLKINRARTGIEITPVFERLAKPVVKKLLAARTREEFDKVLAEVGIEAAQKGRGLIFRDIEDHANQCKASAVSRSLSARALARRLGGEEAQAQGRPAGRGGRDEILAVQSAAPDGGDGLKAPPQPPLAERAKALRKKLKKTRAFEEFQKILADAGLEYAARGNGSVIRDRATGETVKATDVDRSFSRRQLDKMFASPAPARTAAEAAQSGISPDPRIRRGRRRVFRTRIWIITVPQLIRRAEKRGDHVTVTAQKILVSGNPRTGTVWDCARAAAQRFGKGYRVFGDYGFQMRMMKAALALGHAPAFDDPKVQMQFNEALKQRRIEYERKNQLARDLALARALGRGAEGQRQWQCGADPAAMPDVRAVHDHAIAGDGREGTANGDRSIGQVHADAGRGGEPVPHRDALHDDLERVDSRAEQQRPETENSERGRLGAHDPSAVQLMDERGGGRGAGGRSDLGGEAAREIPDELDRRKNEYKPAFGARPREETGPDEFKRPGSVMEKYSQKPQRLPPGLYIRPKDASERALLIDAGAIEQSTGIGKVLRVPLDQLPKLPLDPATVSAYSSYQNASTGRTMSEEEYRRAAGLGRGRSTNDNENSRGGFHL